MLRLVAKGKPAMDGMGPDGADNEMDRPRRPGVKFSSICQGVKKVVLSEAYDKYGTSGHQIAFK
jgi:hypothetical protein